MRAFFFCMAIEAGLLNDPIRVEVAVLNQSAQTGEESKVWTLVSGMAQLPADFQYLSGREYPETFKTIGEVNARCRIRRTPATDLIDGATHRIVFDGKNWDIQSVIKDSDRTVLTIELINRK